MSKDDPADPKAPPGENDPARAAAGSAEITKLYNDYAGQLAGKLRRVYGDGPPDPDDIAQEAFERLIMRGDLASIKNLKGFLWRTACHLLLNGKAREQTQARHDYEIEQLFFPPGGYASTPEAATSAKQQIEAVNRMLATMPRMRRRAFILHQVEGLTVTEVGRQLGISRPAASRHISRAVEAVDAVFAEAEE